MNNTLQNNDKQNYQTLLNQKTEKLCQLFSDVNTPEIEVFESPEKHFRMRAEFHIWHTDDKINYVMFKKGERHKPVNIYEFPNASITISKVMNPLIESIQNQKVLSHKLFQIDFLSTSTGKLLVTLLYHKQLDADWENAARELKHKFGFSLMGRAKKQKIAFDEDFVIEEMHVDNCLYYYQQVESSFTQPNAHICQKMLSWAVKHTKNSKGDLLELYCGNGNFTLPLSKNFDNVLATEVSKTSVKSADYNIVLNKIDNVSIVRLSSEELTQALKKTREFRRLAGFNLEKYAFSAVFVDPPRAGLDDETLEFVSQFDTIIYISCNPDTLLQNISKLDQHSIAQFAMFDQFPFTDHIECGVILKRTEPNG